MMIDIGLIARLITEDPDVINEIEEKKPIPGQEQEGDELALERERALQTLTAIVFGKEQINNRRLKAAIMNDVIPNIQETNKDIRAGDMTPYQALVKLFRIDIARLKKSQIEKYARSGRGPEQIRELMASELWDRIMENVAVIISQFKP